MESQRDRQGRERACGQYRVRKAEETLRRPIGQDRLQIELALLASHWLGRAVLRPVGEPGTGLPRPEA